MLLNQILLLSDNIDLTHYCSSVLSGLYQIDIVLNLDKNFTAKIIIIDADKIDQDNHLLSLFNKKTSRFLIIGNNWPEESQIKALVHGAAGYCNQTDSPALLLQAIESISKGDIWIQRHLVPKVIGALVQMKASAEITPITPKPNDSSKLLATLSNREREVAEMIRSGESNKTIASSLFISERTVKAHLTSIFKKLKVPDRLHLALFIKEFH